MSEKESLRELLRRVEECLVRSTSLLESLQSAESRTASILHSKTGPVAGRRGKPNNP